MRQNDQNDAETFNKIETAQTDFDGLLKKKKKEASFVNAVHGTNNS